MTTTATTTATTFLRRDPAEVAPWAETCGQIRPLIEERDGAEVAVGVPALNLAFDVTPAELVTAIVTEAGVLEPPYEEAIAAVTRR